MNAPWDALRLNQVEEAARGRPDACSADVISLVAEVRQLRADLQSALRMAIGGHALILRMAPRSFRAEGERLLAELRAELAKVGGSKE